MVVKYSCVVDNHPKFKLQSQIWIESLLQNVGCREQDIVVHVVRGTDISYLRKYAERGINILQIDAFGEGNAAYCNKLQQLQSEILLEGDYIVLCDTDLIFLNNIDDVIKKVSGIGAKTVDKPNPPLSILELLYQRTGLVTMPSLVEVDFEKTEHTYRSNCNGGLYVFSQDAFKEIKYAWLKWSTWCLRQDDILGDFIKHSDQLGFCFALIETEITLSILPVGVNFPTHFHKELYSLQHTMEQRRVLHYHSNVTDSHYLKNTGIDEIDNDIKRGNKLIERLHRSSFANSLFWDYRYVVNPDLGSGIGSRGKVLAEKKKILQPLISFFKEKQVIDFGCGDLELMKDFEFKYYTGIDVSEESIRISRLKRPDWRYFLDSEGDYEQETYDLSICFDVLIHQSTREDYDNLVMKLLTITSEFSIIGAYDKKPKYTSSITFYYESISRSIKNVCPKAHLERIGEYRDITVYLVSKNRGTSHNNDIRVYNELIQIGKSKNPNLLEELIELSRVKLGFYPNAIIRSIEYPWVANEVLGRAEGRNNLVVTDVGAGLNILPIWFASKNFKVTTLDPHPLIRSIIKRDEWSEWGFLDYSVIVGSNIESYNTDASKFKFSIPQDFIYSVSVIEHLPAKTRRSVLDNCVRNLAVQGYLILTLDLVPNSKRLWNYSEGKKVEPKWKHGTLNSIKRELKSIGCTIESLEIIRGIEGSRTDVALIVARKMDRD